MIIKFKYLLLILLIISLCDYSLAENSKTELNDIHSKLNKTLHLRVEHPKTIEEIIQIIKQAKTDGLSISISGGKHSMGGQQFGTGTINLSMTDYNKVIGLDDKKGILEVESGIEWTKIVDWLLKNQKNNKTLWGIRQKQTGADNLSIGGALSSNIHGRGLNMKPMIDDVESFTLINAEGKLIFCSRTKNPELFKLVIGGYGLFGVIATVKLRLMPVTVLQREVEIMNIDQFIPLATQKTRNHYLYGDFQFDIDPKSDGFMRRGIYSFYKPVNKKLNEIPAKRLELSEENWTELLLLAHTNKSKAFDIYSQFYLKTNGQLYRSDTNQLGVYVNNYHEKINKDSSEVISEIYVPRDKLAFLFAQLREDFRKDQINVIYGTVRLINKDDGSYLAWAKQNYACIVFNFHVVHSPQGLEKSKRDFRLIIDRAEALGGSFYLTYHRWASKSELLNAYPQFVNFLKLKLKYDNHEVFQSTWYRHYKKMFSHELSGNE
ncbi:putative oxidoreductase ORF5 in fasciation locus [Legionella massiliensis]|uniref:Putative oxidoreductase ORF5 in fasciation locus n=1 Tax=Legionella massiliensis TaxID=1034943 RepID=A0A078L1D0_9GAMM|nr:FAD-binding protein [Legionella massiliensis]CDZ79042.1 putative oxidoreductase ORF5 in fasciation locus [Legionella massiliensis]CEE14780.1 putative oxidoreductase ORF5 in fasciation locus [Legionella massiliensis]